MQAPQDGKPLCITMTRLNGRGNMFVMQVVHLQVHKVLRQFVFLLTVFIGAAAEKNRAKGQFRKAPDDLVNPAGYTPTDIGKGSLQQQHHINMISPRQLLIHQRPPQNWATGPMPGLKRMAGSSCSKRRTAAKSRR